MDSFNARYWNLAQAAAWVVYREKGLVEDLENANRDDYAAIGMYPTMWPEGRAKKGKLSKLTRALVDGRLTSWGYRASTPGKLEEIPSIEWAKLSLRPPLAYDSRHIAARIEPWTDILVRSTDLKKLWRSGHEVTGRSKFDWPAIKKIHDDLKVKNPKFSQNELIEEIQGAFEEQFKRNPPSRSSLQPKMKTWF